ncbi:MAG: hypothetical protein AAFZ15_26020, partial [Bacteroidota bacterium]
MKHAMTSLLLFIVFTKLIAQCPDHITFTSQSQIDSFSIIFPNCKEFPGDIDITETDVTNLQSLSNLTHIGGSLKIWNNPDLLTLEGLNNLVQIGGSMSIVSNHALPTLNGLGSIFHVADTVRIANCSDLLNLSGLGSLKTTGEIWIQDNANLNSLNGLDNLTAVEVFLIRGNYKIENLHGFPQLKSIRDYLSLYNNILLNDISALETIDTLGSIQLFKLSSLLSLTGIAPTDSTIHGDLSIIECEMLSDVDALSNVKAVNGIFRMKEVPNLANLTAVSNIEHLGSINLNGLDFLSSLTIFSSLKTIEQEIALGHLYQLTDLHGLENIDSIQGNLNISHCPAMNNLQGLNNLNFVGKNVRIENMHSLKNMEGLNNLQTIVESAHFQYLDSLENLNGLNALETIGFGLAIDDNDALKNLDGLESLQSLDNILYIESNKNLTDISALSALTNFSGSLHMSKNESLKSLRGLENIHDISGWLSISNCHSLKNMDGLNGLVSATVIGLGYNDSLLNLTGLENVKIIHERLQIEENPHLKNLSGLENLTTISTHLNVYHNPVLENIYGLQNVQEVGGNINIHNNDSLSQCNIFSVCSAIANDSPLNLHDNAPGCTTKDEILLTCDDLFSIASGKVFLDSNCDDSLEGQDILIPYHILKNSDDTPFAATNFTGHYNKLLHKDKAYNFYAPAISGYSSHPENHTIVTDSTIHWYPDFDFNICPDSLFSNLKVILEPLPFARPGFESTFFVCVENIGTQNESGLLTLFFDDQITDNLSFTNSSGGTVAGNSISWEIDPLLLFQEKCFSVSFILDPTTALGTEFKIDAAIELLNSNTDIDLSDNFAANNITVVGSFDPNDKTVDQPEIAHTDSLGKIRLEYLVRFQNTGTYPATFIEVLDTIEEFLDMRSFEMIAASHDYELSFPAENILKWRFDDINLPDSTSNEPESHGFILFSIETFPELNLSDIIKNRAAIYFDFNEPIITNY